MSKNNYWHYQIINKGTKDDPLLCVHEVYFDGQTNKIVGWGQDEKRMLYLQSVDNERIVLVGDSLIKPIQIIPPQSGNVFL